MLTAARLKVDESSMRSTRSEGAPARRGSKLGGSLSSKANHSCVATKLCDHLDGRLIDLIECSQDLGVGVVTLLGNDHVSELVGEADVGPLDSASGYGTVAAHTGDANDRGTGPGCRLLVSISTLRQALRISEVGNGNLSQRERLAVAVLALNDSIGED